MSDASLRVIERLAQQGDPSAERALEAARRRTRGDLPAMGAAAVDAAIGWGEDADEVWKYAKDFTRGDVAEVLHSAPGENDGAEWVAVLRLTDGRYAGVSASCDYTGWG